MTAWRLAVMGPIGVGKDTVCAAVAARLGPGSTVCHCKVGDLVIGDLDDALAATENRPFLDAADSDRLASLRGRLASDPATGPLSVRRLAGRTEYRESLQWWGAVRRRADAGYWLDRLERALDRADRADLIYVSDARREPEVALLRERAFLVVSIVAPPEVCAARAAARDGRPLSPEAYADDEWRSIARSGLADLVVANVGEPDAAAADIVQALTQRELLKCGLSQ